MSSAKRGKAPKPCVHRIGFHDWFSSRPRPCRTSLLKPALMSLHPNQEIGRMRHSASGTVAMRGIARSCATPSVSQQMNPTKSPSQRYSPIGSRRPRVDKSSRQLCRTANI
jgi:hypothetical protein